MDYLFFFLLGLIGGGFCVVLLFWTKLKNVKRQKAHQDTLEKAIKDAFRTIKSREEELDQKIKSKDRALAERIRAGENELQQQELHLKERQAELDHRFVSYKELQDENTILKHDLQNIDVDLRKLQLDRELQNQKKETLDQRSKELGSRYLKENIKWTLASLSTNNFVTCKQRLLDVIERCRSIGFEVPKDEEASLVADLKTEFEKMVRAEFEREEQTRIKAQIREEERLKRETDRELKQLERERAAIKAALEKALAEAKDQHSEEVERLRARLAEAEAKSQRAISMAQMTKAGHVYIISNIGSFGEGVFKIGMTRRLEPVDRVKELSSASVPFPFDVHMMVSCDDAPSLENAIHRCFHKMRMNKVNPRKEFFKTDIEAIRKIVEENHGQVQYIADAEALEYRQTLTMSDADHEYIEKVYSDIEEDCETPSDGN